jgi:DNA-binding response OmpR family regulator
MRRPDVLLVEDDPAVGEAIQFLLERNGFAVRWSRLGREAVEVMDAAPADVLILDLGLPDLSGLDVLREVRTYHRAPVLVLTARSASQDKVAGLDAGADDYLVKPFDAPELLARLRALLRRSGKLATQPVTLGAWELEPATRRLKAGSGASAELTQREVELLETLASVPGKVWTRSQLLEAVWGYETDVDDRTVDSTVKRLRRKMDVLAAQTAAGDRPAPVIRTLYGVGYRMDGLTW